MKKFDYVIGNPPYQSESSGTVSEKNGQKPRTNVFQHFQTEADKIATEATCMIYPGGRWIHQSGKGLKAFGKEQINDAHLSSVAYYPKSSEIFSTTDIPDGITVVMKKTNKTTPGFNYKYIAQGKETDVWVDNPGDELIPLNPQDTIVLNKIDSFVHGNSLVYLHDAILPRSLFNIESDFVENHPESVREFHDGDVIDRSTELKLYTNDKAGAAGRSKWFVVKKGAITKGLEYINQFQVVVSSAHPGGQNGRDNQLSIVDDMSAFGRARVALRSFKTREEAENFFAYMQAPIIRYALLATDEALSAVAKRVPDIVDYTSSNRYIDFTKSIDEQLCKLIGFTDEEYEFILAKVKASNKKEANQ